MLRTMGFEERERRTGIHIKLLRNDMIAEMIGSDLATIDALGNIPFDEAKKALSELEDAPVECQDAAIREISNYFTSDGMRFNKEDFSTIELMQIEKGLTASEICKELLKAFPDAVETAETTIETLANIPIGSLSLIRSAIKKCKINWVERFDCLPNIREPANRFDPLLGLEDSKGIERKTAARLLWIAYADAIKKDKKAA